MKFGLLLNDLSLALVNSPIYFRELKSAVVFIKQQTKAHPAGLLEHWLKEVWSNLTNDPCLAIVTS